MNIMSGYNTPLEVTANNIKYSINNMSVLNFIFNFTLVVILSISLLFSLLKSLKSLNINIDLFDNIFFDLTNKTYDTHKPKYIYITILVIILIFTFINFTMFADFTTKNTKELNKVASNDIIKSVLDKLNKQIPIFSVSFGISLFFILFLVIKNIFTYSSNTEKYIFSLRYTWIFILLSLVIILLSILFSTNYIIEANKPVENSEENSEEKDKK